LGKCEISSPQINTNTTFTLNVLKEKYQTYDGDSKFSIHLLSSDFPHHLVIQSANSDIIEGTLFSFKVTDENGLPIPDVNIWEENRQLTETTNTNGNVTITIPNVFLDKTYYIYATKTGYQFSTKNITIHAQDSNRNALHLQINTSIEESEVFHVFVTNDGGLPLKDAVVTFNLAEKQTDENGEVSFTAPLVLKDTFFQIAASKSGYFPASNYIDVLDTNNTNISSFLQIDVISQVKENEDFTVIVRDQNDYPIMNAQVTFQGITQLTNIQGITHFSAPNVSWDTSREIKITKKGYVPITIEILILNTDSFPYWLLIVIIVIVLIIGIAAYLRYRQYMI
jgi:hypothetical protein